MSSVPESHLALPASPGGSTRRGILRTAMWSVPAITVVSAAPAYADSTGPAAATRFVSFDALTYTWPDMEGVEPEEPWVDGAIEYFIETDEPGPSPAVIVHVTFPDSWTESGTRDVTVTYGGDFSDFGNWSPSVSPVDGAILTRNSLSFAHPFGLPLGDFNPHIDRLSFTAFVRGVDLSYTTDPIALAYEFVDQAAAESAGWGIAANSSPAILHFDGNWGG
ncbi:hypothetical protein [Nocardioides gilvus]|uniref:hypothetical protein n=1 Tax=Nocardioides gilvus TaxID=1735589 RepID=UPI000D746381|nr:hypothetical protein [Nocardioides gilvus]